MVKLTKDQHLFRDFLHFLARFQWDILISVTVELFLALHDLNKNIFSI